MIQRHYMRTCRYKLIIEDNCLVDIVDTENFGSGYTPRHVQDMVGRRNPCYSSFDEALYDKDQTELIWSIPGKGGVHRMPQTCKTIGKNAFCWSFLDEVIINEGLETICENAFENSNIKISPIIPRTVVNIGINAFGYKKEQQCIRVYKDSYAHAFAEKHNVKYSCVPEHGEAAWCEQDWLKLWSVCYYRYDNRYNEIMASVFENTCSVLKAESYMTTKGDVVVSPFAKGKMDRIVLYGDETVHCETRERYFTEMRVVFCDAVSLTRKLSAVESDVCLLLMPLHNSDFSVDAMLQWLIRTDYSELEVHDKTIYAPEMTIFREPIENGYALLQHPSRVNMIVMPFLRSVMEKRLSNLLRIACANGQKTLVIDCMRFRDKYDLMFLADFFSELLNGEFRNCFKRVFFAMDKLDCTDEECRHFVELFGENVHWEVFMPDEVLSMDANPDGRIRLLHSERFCKNISWSLYSNGILEISGSGRIPDYTDYKEGYLNGNQAPWIDCAKYGVVPTKVRICEGITYVGQKTFSILTSLAEVELPESVKTIAEGAFPSSVDAFVRKQ